MFRKKEKGFTLIELLVVIAILGVLAGVAVPRVMGAVENARRNANMANQAIVQSAVERFQIDRSTWPTAGPFAPGTGLPTTIQLIVAAELANYLQGGRLPPIQAVNMPNTAGTVNDVVVAAGSRWALNTAGVAVIVPSGALTQTWPAP